MLTAYLVCLVVGGVFVGLSVFAGMKEGGGADKDLGGKDFDKDLGGKDFDKSFEKDFELEGGHGGPPLPMDGGGSFEGGHGGPPLPMDDGGPPLPMDDGGPPLPMYGGGSPEGGHGGPPLPMDGGGSPEGGHGGPPLPQDGAHHDGALAHEAPTSDAALAGHPGEKRQAPRRRFQYKRGPWLPFTSVRFWTFGSCFFGLTGVALTQLAGVGEPTAALASLGVGLASGTGTAWLVHKLRQPVGAVGSARGWVGVVGELAHPLAAGQVSKVRVRQPGRPPRELLAELADHSGPLPRDCKVVVLDFRDGRAVVQAADPAMLSAPERPVNEVQASPVAQEEES